MLRLVRAVIVAGTDPDRLRTRLVVILSPRNNEKGLRTQEKNGQFVAIGRVADETEITGCRIGRKILVAVACTEIEPLPRENR